jgi:hypothetical protein
VPIKATTLNVNSIRLTTILLYVIVTDKPVSQKPALFSLLFEGVTETEAARQNRHVIRQFVTFLQRINSYWKLCQGKTFPSNCASVQHN